MGVIFKNDVSYSSIPSSSNILNTVEEIESNTDESKIAGALAVKELNNGLIKTAIQGTTFTLNNYGYYFGNGDTKGYMGEYSTILPSDGTEIIASIPLFAYVNDGGDISKVKRVNTEGGISSLKIYYPTSEEVYVTYLLIYK